jgi:hypothetical protein
MHALIGGADMNRLKAGSKISCRVRLFMGVEGCLILPDLQDDESVRSPDFLYHLDARIPAFFLGGFAVLLNKPEALTGQRRLDIDIRCCIKIGHHHHHDEIAENEHALSYVTLEARSQGSQKIWEDPFWLLTSGFLVLCLLPTFRQT